MPEKFEKLAVWIATIGGLGKIRWAPGTWGSLVGLIIGTMTVHVLELPQPQLVHVGFWWLWLSLLSPLVLTFILCAIICGAAERTLSVHDAPAIILDEAWAMTFIVILNPWAVSSWLWLLFIAFLLFRFFEIVKPPPLKRLERLAGGWGIMADDLGAAIYTVVIVWIITFLYILFTVH